MGRGHIDEQKMSVTWVPQSITLTRYLKVKIVMSTTTIIKNSLVVGRYASPHTKKFKLLYQTEILVFVNDTTIRISSLHHSKH